MTSGDYVKFNDSNGSISKILEPNHYGGFIVEWVYGRDVAGDIMTAQSNLRKQDLILIAKEEYFAMRDRPPTNGQKD